MKYYHLIESDLKAGQIILAGRWGALSRKNTPHNNAHVLLREWILENIRLRFYPRLPSRLDSIFLCEKLDHAIEFAIHDAREGHIYEVALVQEGTPILRTDYTFYGMSEWDTVEILEEKSHHYWRGGSTAYPEVVTTSDVKVVRKVDQPEIDLARKALAAKMNQRLESVPGSEKVP